MSTRILLLAAAMLASCATAPPPVPTQCRPSNYDLCAAHCAASGRGASFILENQSDVQCACAKPAPAGT